MTFMNPHTFRFVSACLILLLGATAKSAAAPFEISGIYPHLASFNTQPECGTGAVVPWADRLWVITYAPHQPKGSDDKLYEIDAELNMTARPESVGGTPANRMIHRESQQLLIGPYLIDRERRVRVIPPDRMFGRLTGTARHLTDPANKVYYATMEEGIYEVDVHDLTVTELFRDEQLPGGHKADLPGYHGKGLYTGQGRLVYANNGENSPLARQRPDIPSGVLASWDGSAGIWQIIRRNQFTEVTGPGGIQGNEHPATDPVWSIGWDHRSLLLMVLEAGNWHTYRLPKSSHAYDGAHGWNTEWPRIRDIGEASLLMTMHGAFWRFPANFGPTQSAGIRPRSNYLKVIGDFAFWQGRVVMGCDDTARSGFLNRRGATEGLAAPGQSQSNLWFVAPEQLDHLGPVVGRGAVWVNDQVAAGAVSDAFLFSGFDRRILHLTHGAETPVTFTLEVDRKGNNQWTKLRSVEVPASGYVWTAFAPTEEGAWIRVRTAQACTAVTAMFFMSQSDGRKKQSDARFDGLPKGGEPAFSEGMLHARGGGRGTLRFAATRTAGGEREPAAYYEMGPDMKLQRKDEPAELAWMKSNLAFAQKSVVVDAASVLCTDDQGRRFRLPKGRMDAHPAEAWAQARTMREVCTERDLLNCAGTFFEVPAENAGGLAKIRPVATHNRRISDFASWRGLLIMSGIVEDAPAGNRHIIRSEDGRVALWAGAVDDLWSLGKVTGVGGPWLDSRVEARQPSDPYLMSGYDRKVLRLSHQSDHPVSFNVEVDITGDGNWVTYKNLEVPAGQPVVHAFPDAFDAYWVRLSAGSKTTATAMFNYE